MYFAQLDSVLMYPSHCIARFLELNCQMAGVVINSQVCIDARILGVFGAHPLEKRRDLPAGFQHAHRLGFESQMKLASRLGGKARHMLNATPEIIANDLHFFLRGNQFLETTGHGADASFHVAGEQLRQQIEEQIRIMHSPGRSPIRKIDLFLDSSAVKRAIRKAVYGEDVTVILAEPPLKFKQPGPIV